MASHLETSSHSHLKMDLGENTERLLDKKDLQATTARIFGVNYLHLKNPNFGDLYITDFGLPKLEFLLPEMWNDEAYYQEHTHLRETLPGSSHPRKVTTKPIGKKTLDLVVKWCRVGTYVELVKSEEVDFITDEEIQNAQWNGPFEEFGLLMELRDTNQFTVTRLMTQLPLAIFSPATRSPTWRMGRDKWKIEHQNRMLRGDQSDYEEPIELDIRRKYAMLYQWVRGEDAYTTMSNLGMSGASIRNLTKRVYEDLLFRGYKVIDTKPSHFIVRERHGKLMQDRRGNIPFTLIDFELLQRSRSHQQRYHKLRRQRYWMNQNSKDRLDEELPDDFTHMNVFGVDYIHGKTSGKGRLSVVGKNPELFDFFEPTKWRRTPRIQLSHTSFRTRTRDDVELVYKSSRFGQVPQSEFTTDLGKRIRDFGYNSPFEEVAIAEELRKLGINTTYPRAIYRTEHESLPAEYLSDKSRIESHRDLFAQGEPILDDKHDYCVLWGCWRGLDPIKDYTPDGHWGLIGLIQAYNNGIISDEQYRHLAKIAEERLERIGFPPNTNLNKIILSFDDGELKHDTKGEIDVRISIDAYRAFEYGLLTEDDYRHLVQNKEDKLLEHGYEPISLRGDNFLLVSDLYGNLRIDVDGEIERTLCSFELIRAPWMKY